MGDHNQQSLGLSCPIWCGTTSHLLKSGGGLTFWCVTPKLHKRNYYSYFKNINYCVSFNEFDLSI